MSVVVPVRRAPDTIVSTMTELLERQGLEIIAVVSKDDPTSLLLRQLQAKHTELILVEVNGDWSVPQLRARGVRQARGRLVAITEDHCSFSESWPAALAPALDDPAIAAVGGPVVNARRKIILDWAVFFSRYASSMPPVVRGPARTLAGNNVCYRRELLETHAPPLLDGFWEHEFHEELLRQGLKLWLEPDARVSHRKHYRLAAYCSLRFRHGDCFAGRQRDKLSFWGLQRRILLAPFVPFLLSLRTARAVLWKGTQVRAWLLAAPLLLLFHAMWALGELTGYILEPGESCSHTD
jgi:hypothetical protein